MAVDDNQIQEKFQAIMQEFSDNEGDDGDRHRRAPLAKARGGDRPRPSAVQPRMSVLGGSNRRRSSIFLRRTSVGGSSVATLGTLGAVGNSASQAHLDALYKKAIRMNAENRINAANSWNLNLIEHIDKFVHDDDGGSSASSRRSDSNRRSSTGPAEEDTERRVNFTKASCTLDASIKVRTDSNVLHRCYPCLRTHKVCWTFLLSFLSQIYSYRVDDVHLTSYKVLANLSRNDAEGTKAKQADDRHADDHHGDDLGEEDDGNGDDAQTRGRSRRKPEFKATGPTLESNVCTSSFTMASTQATIDRRSLAR
jgi:Condensin complex subunit 2